MRLFIAVNLNDKTRSRLLALRDELHGKSQRGNFSAPENLHLTLAFLGECDSKQTAAVKSVLDTVSFEPFNITIDCIGRFKHDDGDIWWAGLNESKQLSDLHQKLTADLCSHGFNIDKRKYNPHITLGREVVTDVKPWVIEPFGETVSAIDLMKSERINGRLTYTSIYRHGKRLSPIVVEPYNPQWAREFERIRDYLASKLGDLAVAIHHVGSTSVTGLAAKPIIDIDIEIASYEVFPQVCEKLMAVGWRHEGDYGIAKREEFKLTKQFDFMRHNLYVCPSDSAEMIRHLEFRDYLRGDKAAVDEYGKLKQQLAVKHRNDIDAYIDGKSAFIKRILDNKGERSE